MAAPLTLRPLTSDEARDLHALAQGQKGEARLRDRARICWRAHQGDRVATISVALGVGVVTVRHWMHRFNAEGLDGLADAPRIGRPPTYTPEEVGAVIATSLTPPEALELPFGSWTLDRLAAYLPEERGIAMRRSRIGEVLQAEGLRWRTEATWFGARVDPTFADKRGRLSPSPPRRPQTAS